MKAIVAVDKNWGIGKDGRLLVHLPGDLNYFKEKTTDQTEASFFLCLFFHQTPAQRKDSFSLVFYPLPYPDGPPPNQIF